MKIRLETRSQFYKIYTSLADPELDKIEQTRKLSIYMYYIITDNNYDKDWISRLWPQLPGHCYTCTKKYL